MQTLGGHAADVRATVMIPRHTSPLTVDLSQRWVSRNPAVTLPDYRKTRPIPSPFREMRVPSTASNDSSLACHGRLIC